MLRKAQVRPDVFLCGESGVGVLLSCHSVEAFYPWFGQLALPPHPPALLTFFLIAEFPVQDSLVLSPPSRLWPEKQPRSLMRTRQPGSCYNLGGIQGGGPQGRVDGVAGAQRKVLGGAERGRDRSTNRGWKCESSYT